MEECYVHTVGPCSAILAYLVKVVTSPTPIHVANIANEWLPCTNILVPYIDTESENQNSGFNIFLVSTHSACPYKNCGLKWSQKSQTLFYFFFQGMATLSRKTQKVCKQLDTYCGGIQCNFSIFGKGRHVDHAHSRSKHCK